MTSQRPKTTNRFRLLLAVIGAAVMATLELYRRNRSQRWSVRTDVKIAAHPEDVWSTLVDFSSYPEWNPFLIKMDGVPSEGQPLKGVTLLNSGRTFGFNSRFARVDASRHLSWGGGSRRILSGIHWLDLEPVDGGESTLVTHGEDWTGILIPLLMAFGMDEQRYTEMNEALRIRTEQNVTGPLSPGAGDHSSANRLRPSQGVVG